MALTKQLPVEIRNPNAVRPWQHVLEPLTGYLLLGTQLADHPEKYAQAYNFGPDLADALSVLEMTQLAIEKWGSGTHIIKDQTAQVHEAGLLKLDVSKAKVDLGWTPKMNAAQSVAYTIDWYKAYYAEPATIEKFTQQQIIEFLT